MENTNYSKESMIGLRQDIETKTREFENHVSTIEALIKDAGNYWVESDSEARGIYEELNARFNEFNTQLNEGREILSEFAKTVGNQVESYRTAEANSYSSLQ